MEACDFTRVNFTRVKIFGQCEPALSRDKTIASSSHIEFSPRYTRDKSPSRGGFSGVDQLSTFIAYREERANRITKEPV